MFSGIESTTGRIIHSDIYGRWVNVVLCSQISCHHGTSVHHQYGTIMDCECEGDRDLAFLKGLGFCKCNLLPLLNNLLCFNVIWISGAFTTFNCMAKDAARFAKRNAFFDVKQDSRRIDGTSPCSECKIHDYILVKFVSSESMQRFVLLMWCCGLVLSVILISVKIFFTLWITVLSDAKTNVPAISVGTLKQPEAENISAGNQTTVEACMANLANSECEAEAAQVSRTLSEDSGIPRI
ncbi:hypothetical protein PHYBLDRAFT_153663 [Phycomyces blakesleeanus NRRL 1555(-)]|uniref:Uncharacterized protein n=1 Tax=Phycomyces blakesleeanus (strain ATCC 8743b / DSM 1359 / FGSC 10004 / NBRC 33097 / NRRL 1555) TaxID=763407 RepID=A0A162Z9R4_PHYB8|nr:hypothetical protein PHYBLDRAFT_153663 [Phycomyces blakesleeanus NRRL 1555(-)]OAD65271.1 hypothetical protein PHYBLDRAFT_153663 [Phycomyces blakesleeanus NRRL 1555(-)]|eukprot:XP_018283311.1 hypothetical protein PHYBLDRAFT_153663 [Phycomyces blakesleeanus NRRL 1555(-)]